MQPDVEYISAKEAQELLGVSKPTMTKLLRAPELPPSEDALTYVFDPLDKRTKWVRRADVLKLKARSDAVKEAAKKVDPVAA